jgi:calcineurin-like phosphoesterase family protein
VSKTFLISDPHFSHFGVCKFLNPDGSKLRPWDHPDDMDKELIENINDEVKENDKMYILGDLCINRRGLHVVGGLRCKNLVLIKGNHDIFKLEDYTPYFRDIRAYHVLNKMILSHIPVHTSQLERFRGNVHGHLHYHDVLDDKGNKDLRYYSVCVEKINYRPIDIEVGSF